MENSEFNLTSKELQKFVEFINTNSPLPQQSVPETMELLDQHVIAACTEITINLSSLHKYDMSSYYQWAEGKLSEIQIREFKRLIEKFQNPMLRSETTTGQDIDNFQVSKQLSEALAAQKERFAFMLDILDRYAKKRNEVFDHLSHQFLLNHAVERLVNDQEKVISEELERMHQHLYEHVLDFLENARGFHMPKQGTKALMDQLEMFFEFQKTEINNNYHGFPAEITTPYLAQMHRFFEKHQQKIRKVLNGSPTLIPLKRRSLTQLKELCEQVQQFQELQARHSYTLTLDKIFPENKPPFVLFLLLRQMDLLSLFQEHFVNEELKLIETIEALLKISQPLIREYLELSRQPVSCWSQEQQRQLQLVDEFLERKSALIEYKYPEDLVAQAKASYW